jgi:uncharacterized membrane protein YphA (DoxX/SURF4 family)
VRICASRRPWLQRFFSSFPEGWPGVGLILLRLTVALNAIFDAVYALTAPNGTALSVWILGLLSIAIAIALLIGFFTPLAGLSAAIGYLLFAISCLMKPQEIAHFSSLTELNLAAVSVALVLFGPGAYSLDARLFGRREIIIPDSRRAPRQ